ncbi:unnamed protein product [Periconia digitata]|uniref:Uncharacterized protein n=1 Tax=Periconia digitata TaxID=1303443 RepID=A0A9W4XQ80_9PLEO|nr:unnamed protein product [Periconia digitata]
MTANKTLSPSLTPQPCQRMLLSSSFCRRTPCIDKPVYLVPVYRALPSSSLLYTVFEYVEYIESDVMSSMLLQVRAPTSIPLFPPLVRAGRFS